MSVKEDIKVLLLYSDKSLTELSQMLSKKYGKNVTVQGLSRKINKGTIKYEEVKDIAELLGYKIRFGK